jgi:hypothetical protein
VFKSFFRPAAAVQVGIRALDWGMALGASAAVHTGIFESTDGAREHAGC